MAKFKKIVITGVLAMSLMLCSACTAARTTDFSAKYYWGSHKYGYSAFLINSKQEFDAVFTETGTIYDDFNVYDDGFFAKSSLVALFLPIGSGSIKLRVNRLDYDASGITVQIDKYSPMMQTCDMSYWLILVEPEKKLQPETNVEFGFNNTSHAFSDLRKRI